MTGPFDPNEGNRSPAQTFGLAPNKIPKFGDPELLPKGEVTRGSNERNFFGGRERGGASGGVLHPDGPGPYPADVFSAIDIDGIPWRRTRGNEWTTEPFRTQVKSFISAFVQARPEQRIIGWQVEEVANGARMGSRRLSPDDHHLVFRITVRRVTGKVERLPESEAAINFPPDQRDTIAVAAKLVLIESTLDLLLAVA